MAKLFFYIVLLISLSTSAAESELHGIFDIRALANKSIPSYLESGYGKFDNSDGQNLSLAQAGLSYSLSWQSGISAHLITNAYLNKTDNNIGFTEGYLKYRSLVNSSGYRWESKLGIFYPKISIENNAIAWASKYTLTSSSINTWIGEEIRVLGNEWSITRLGRFHKNPYDISFSLTPFINNDPAGSMISWHGWTIGNRQTLWTESRPLPSILALREGNPLAHQAKSSDPFLELDSRIGLHGTAKLKLHNKGELTAGIYHNNAKPYIVENGQYAWKTRFFHFSGKWQLPYGVQISGQFLSGDTLMQNPQRVNMVYNDYRSGYVTLTKRWKKHRFTTRLEEFSVTDHDDVIGDNNNEYGKAATLNYTYRISKPFFLSVEYNWLKSYRPSRVYLDQPINLIEHQSQLAARYFF